MHSIAAHYGITKPPSTGVRFRLRALASKLTTPLGAASLAVLSFAGGLWVASSLGVPGGELEETRAALADESEEARDLRSRLAVREIQLQRLRAVQAHSSAYGIPADLAASVYDIAVAEGIRPELAFKLVEIESSYRRHAVSAAGAVGYTQIKLSTARLLRPDVTLEQLFERETNLRLGFRYLRLLLDRYEGDERLALLAYNRGPTRVGSLLSLGLDPSNGYARRILEPGGG